MTSLDSFYKNRKVFVTGHTGFKGSWLIAVLHQLGADVWGYSLRPATEPALYKIMKGETLCCSNIGDIRDYPKLKRVFDAFQPEIVLHLAAQPIVLESYKNPVGTYSTNVMGTVNILECVRQGSCVKSFLNVTTDKVYKNNDDMSGYREDDELCGLDPYSNSKSCSELVTYSYKNSFFKCKDIALSTMRAGNVIGGGDFAPNRIIPDCVRSAIKKQDIFVRNPYSVRPYQHVLESLFAYLRLAMLQYQDRSCADCYNIGPDESDIVTTGRLVEIFCEKWGGIKWTKQELENMPQEASFLKLDNTKVKQRLGIKPVWNLDKAIEMTTQWTKALLDKRDIQKEMIRQIAEYRKCGEF